MPTRSHRDILNAWPADAYSSEAIIAGTKHEWRTLDAYAPAGDKLSKAMFEFPASIPRK